MNTPVSKVEEPFGRIFSGLGKEYLSLLRARLQHLDIDRNYYALVLIESHMGIITQQELALELQTDKVSIVRIIDYLSANGYITRVRKTNDRRKHSLMLTEKALIALPEVKRSFSEINQIALNGLGDSQVSAFLETIIKIKRNLTENISSL
ncbi:MAG: MarR family winged helix-turn-helix transcriptional regulator [Bacteroidota bacterium]